MVRLIYCPYCRKVVKTRFVDWLWLVVSLLTANILIYLLYCAFIGSRICPLCERRIYEVRGKKIRI